MAPRRAAGVGGAELTLAGRVLLGALLAGAAVDPGGDPLRDPIRREVRVRAWALEPAARRDAWSVALASSSWLARTAALDALERALALGADPELEERVRDLAALALDDHPNVRAAALRLLARLPRVELGPAALDALAADPLPDARAALAERLGRVPPADAAARLTALARDRDPGVARAAEASLLALVAEAEGAALAAAEAAVLGLLDDVGPPGSAAWLARVELLARSRPTPALLDALAARARVGGESDGPGALALIEALRCVVHGEGDPRVLAEGFAVESARDARRRRWMLRGAACAPEDVAARLLADLCADGGAAPHAAERLAGAVELLPPTDLLAALRELDCAAPDASPPELARRAWERLLGVEATWTDAELEPWRTAPDPELRLTVVDTLATSLALHEDAAAGRALARALDDPAAAVRQRAFQGLCEARDPRPWLAALFASWRARDEAGRAALLQELPRGAPLEAFRDDLLELGDRRRGARALASELLAELRGDERVVARLGAWLDEELARLPREPAGERRASELVAMGAVRALERACGGCEALFERVVEATQEESVDVAKHAARALGGTPAGRARLRRFLGPDAVRRVAIEAALALAPHGDAGGEDAAAVAVLDASFATCDWELKDRVLRELGRLAGPGSRELLARVARDGTLEAPRRVAAVSALERRGEAGTIAAALPAARDLETRLAVVEALGRLGGAAARAALRARFDELSDPRTAGAAELVAVERGALVAALARAGELDEPLRSAWLAPALERAPRDLAARFEGRRGPDPGFAFRAEIAAARALAEAGVLEEALDAAGAWWGLDARLLGRLAEAAAASGPQADGAARRAWLATLAALFGEPRADEGAALALRARCALLAAAERGRDWRAFEHWASEIGRELRAGRTPEGALEQALGELRPRAGVDPLARLDSARLQARAWRALEDGDGAAAEGWARRAEERVGHSLAAREAQARLWRAVAAAR